MGRILSIALVALLCWLPAPQAQTCAETTCTQSGETIHICLIAKSEPGRIPPGCDCLFWRCAGLGGEYCTDQGNALCYWDWTRSGPAGAGPTGGGGYPSWIESSSWADLFLFGAMWPPGSRCDKYQHCLAVLEQGRGRCEFSDGPILSGTRDHLDLRARYMDLCVLGRGYDGIPMPDLGIRTQPGVPMPTLKQIIGNAKVTKP